MRKQLAKLGVNYVGSFVGTIQKISSHTNKWKHLRGHRYIKYKTTNLCLEHIKQIGSHQILAQHIWVKTKVPYNARYQFKPGSQVKFKGTVYQYIHDYHGVKPWLANSQKVEDFSLSFDQQLLN